MDLYVGQRAFRSITLTADHVKAYAEITGDYNPLHFDAEFTSKTRFGKLVVQGGLTTGLLHALVPWSCPGLARCSSARIGTSPRRCLLGTPLRRKQKYYQFMRANP